MPLQDDNADSLTAVVSGRAGASAAGSPGRSAGAGARLARLITSPAPGQHAHLLTAVGRSSVIVSRAPHTRRSARLHSPR
jgi:hypothetical protein